METNNEEKVRKNDFDNLNKLLMLYLKDISSYNPDNPFNLFIQNLAFSILPNTVNSYQNNNLSNESFYNPGQTLIINSIYKSIRGNNVEGILSVLENANSEVSESGLSFVDQTPLYVAISVGKASCRYWAEIFQDENSKWNEFIGDSIGVNVSNLPYWVTASIEGALSGFAQIQEFEMGAATTLNTIGKSFATVSALLGAIGLTSGKVLFKWVKNVNTQRLTLDKQTITRLNKPIEGDVQGLWGTRVLCFMSRAHNCSEASCGGTRTMRTGEWHGVVIACFNL